MDAQEIVTAITERVKDAANVDVVFGDVVETPGGVSIIPVASVKVSGGGGGGRGKANRPGEGAAETSGDQSGIGLGVSVTARPLGYIEIKNEGARFIPTPDVTKIAVASMMAAGMLFMTVNRLMRLKAWRAGRRMRWQHMHA